MTYLLRQVRCLVSLSLTLAVLFALPFALPGNAIAAPSFSPGFEPVSSDCDGDVRFVNWAQDIRTDADPAQLRFQVTAVSNPEIFDKNPWVSWPSRSLNYRIKPGTSAGLASTVTAILIDDASAQVSAPQSWHIFTRTCDTGDTNIDTDNDTDKDGVSDRVDTDDDNDGISDIDEGNGLIDTDGDGTANSLDSDSDNDSIADAAEPGDRNDNGIRDSEEANPGTNIVNRDVDRDGDGVHDDIDIDDDNDGIVDIVEGAGLVDTDNDGIADSLDLDSDNDGRSDLLESGLSLILLAFSANWSLQDAVGDNGLVDLIETAADSGVPLHQPVDVDGNGTPDFQDNAALLFNDIAMAENEAVTADESFVTTGIEGVGCRLARGIDPSLVLLLVVALAGLWRRRR